MVQVHDTPFFRECVADSKAATEIRKQKHPYTDRPLDGSAVETLYRHGIYLLRLYEDLLKKDRNVDFGFLSFQNEKMLNHARYGVYLELCDFGLEQFAENLREVYLPK